MEPVIVVTGKPTVPSAAKAQWIQYLMTLNFMFFVYHCLTEDYSRTYDFVFVFGMYAVYGAYLPAHGLHCLIEHTSTHLFVVWQSALSTFHLMFSIFNLVMYYNYEQMCHDCVDVFRDGQDVCETVWADTSIQVELAKCMQLPDEETVLCKHIASILLSLVGIMTAYKVSRVESTTSTVEAIRVSDPEVIAQILERHEESV
jgi:hypothetical protein